MAGWRDWAAGAAIGGLVGLLIGLSVSSVVGSAIGALTALLAAFFGLSKDFGGEGSVRFNRMIGFGVACAAMMLAGVGLRTHDTLSPSISDRIAEWTDAGYEAETARSFVALQMLGVQPEGTKVSAQREAGPQSSVLFSERAEVCAALDPTGKSVAGWSGQAEFEGGAWALAARYVATANSEAEKRQAMTDAWTMLCDGA